MQFSLEGSHFKSEVSLPLQQSFSLATHLLRKANSAFPFIALAAGQFAQVADINANKIRVNYLIKSYIRPVALLALVLLLLLPILCPALLLLFLSCSRTWHFVSSAKPTRSEQLSGTVCTAMQLSVCVKWVCGVGVFVREGVLFLLACFFHSRVNMQKLVSKVFWG